MSVASSVAFALAERVERSAGPRAGLVAYKALTTSGDGQVRAKAILASLRCALALRDREALGALSALWPTVDRGMWDEPIAALCKEMARAGSGWGRQAIELARAEVTRHRTARSLYLHARCVDVVARDDDDAARAQAVILFRDAIDRADKEGRDDIALASRVRRAALLSRSWLTMGEAIDEARRVDPKRVSPESRLVVAGILLLSSSRFTRAAAIGTLDELVVGDDASVASRALMEAARWADDVGGAITPLEIDRLNALFGRPRVVTTNIGNVARARTRILQARSTHADVASALVDASRLDGALEARVQRARDIASGRFEASRERSNTTAGWAGYLDAVLDVAVALRGRVPARAARALRFLLDAEERGERLPYEVLAVADASLAYDDEELGDIGARFFEARLRQPRAGAPPRGFLALADALAASGRTEAAVIARHAAAVANEPGAVEALGTVLAREGWEYARSGDRARAIDALRAAKAILDPKGKTA
jgi:hypothetical protein